MGLKPRLLRRNIFGAFLKSPSPAGSPPRSGVGVGWGGVGVGTLADLLTSDAR
ncbi:MAG: hypothetical protein SWX82_14065 [Cyanobacteriota bacterium]|nr:hypothetical protein [Cyanobacteriota bacterium]